MLGFIRQWLERRAAPTWQLSRLSSWGDMGIGAGPTSAGVIVTPEAALTVPTVFACIAVLSQDVARCPVRLRRRVDADTFIDAADHGLWELLHDLPNPETSAYDFKRQ